MFLAEEGVFCMDFGFCVLNVDFSFGSGDGGEFAT